MMTQKLPLRSIGGRIRLAWKATTLRLQDELEGDTEALTYHTRQSKKKH